MMSEEPRRSVRATKGTHKGLDTFDQPAESTKKRSGKKGGSKKSASQEVEEEHSNDIIRCICGAREQDDDTDEAWIACDNCDTWQHNVCVGVDMNVDDDYKYFCEQCKPEMHKELLDAIERGEKPWENRRQIHEEAQEKKPKKGGKKGKNKRVSDSKSELSQASKVTPDPASEIPANLKKEKKDTVSRSGASKRKARDGSHDKEAPKEPQTKIRKTSPTSTKSSSAGTTSTIDGLPKQRQGPAKFIHRGLEHAIANAQKNGTYTPANNVTAEQKILQLTIEIEKAVFDTHPNEGYIAQAKSLGFNLKNNQELCDRLLSADLTTSALATMTSDEMRSKALQKETAEMQARNDKASIMVTDDGPRIRRTHKGEEIIEDDFAEAGTDSMPMPASRRRSMLDPNGDMATRSRENSPSEQVELPQDIDSYRSRDDIRGHTIPKGPLNINTQPTPSGQRKSSQANDFDFNKVLSSVRSPSVSQPTRRVSGPAPGQNQPSQKQGPGEDPDIDRLLEDDAVPESPPYSPSQYDADPNIVWRGTLNMNSIARFSATAKHVAGVNLGPKGTNVVSWSELMPKDLNIAGRIDQDKASEYLCGLKYSAPTDIVVVALSPSGEVAEQDFSKVFDYFLSKTRFGVIGNKGFANVRDTYLIPVPAGSGNIPEFMQALEDCSFPETRTEPSLLVVFVVRNEHAGPPSADPSRTFDGAHSPSTPYGHPQRQLSTGGFAPTMSPMAPQGGFGSPATPMPPQTLPLHSNNDDAARARREAQARGERTAAEILGDLFRAPTMQFLLPQAHIMHPKEWRVILDLYRQEPKTQTDLQQLSMLLEQKNNASAK